MNETSLLEELLSPMPLADFRRFYLGQHPYAAPEKAERFRKLISWKLMDEIFQTGHGDCWLPKNGRLPEDEALSNGRLDLATAARGFESGRTVLVRHSERAHPLLRKIADDFEALFGWPVDIQIYCTPPGEFGFDWHYDIEDVFVIQSAGEKEFYLRKNKLNPPEVPVRTPKTQRELEAEWEGPEVRCYLREGDWLYIPSGYWHKARALSPSFHFSVGVLDKVRLGMETKNDREVRRA